MDCKIVSYRISIYQTKNSYYKICMMKSKSLNKGTNLRYKGTNNETSKCIRDTIRLMVHFSKEVNLIKGIYVRKTKHDRRY